MPGLDAGGGLPIVKEWINRIVPVTAAEAALWTIPATIMALAFLRMVSSFSGDYGSAWLSNHMQANLRRQMFARILRLPNDYFDQSSTGTTLSRVTFDANQVSQAGLNVVNVVVRDSVATAGYLVSLFSIDWQLAVFCLGLLPLVALVVVFAGRRMRRISGNAQRAMGELTHVLDESIGGQRVVKIFGGAHYEQRRFDTVVKLNRQLAVKHAATAALNSGVIMVLVSATPLLAHRIEDRANGTKVLLAFERAEATRDFLLDLGHADGPFCLVIGKRHIEIADEAQHGVGMQVEAA